MFNKFQRKKCFRVNKIDESHKVDRNLKAMSANCFEMIKP